MILEEGLKSHYESLSRSIAFARSADAKAEPVLALQVAILGALASRFEKLIAVLWVESLCFGGAFLWVILGAYLVFMGVAVAMATRVYVPMHPHTGESLIHFEDIAKMKSEALAKRAKKMGTAYLTSQSLSGIIQAQ